MASHTPSKSTKVLRWLEQLPSPKSDLTRSQDEQQSPHRSTPERKRRRPLHEMDGNVRTPKRARDDPPEMDSNQTPRQSKAPGWTSPPSLPPPSFQNLSLVNVRDTSPSRGSGIQSRSESSTSTASSKKMKRSPSPRKNVGLRYAVYHIDPGRIQEWPSMPEEMQALTKSMMIYKAGREIVSPDYPLDDLRNGVDDEHLTSAAREALGSCPRDDWAKEIASETDLCITRKVSEAAWNCDVHSRILRQALRCSNSAQSGIGMLWHNITTASIEPASLLPLASESTTFQSRRADFALCLELPEGTARQLSLLGVQSLNPTFYEPLRFAPLACSVETKLSGEGWEDAKTQIETWASAQVAHLRGSLQQVEQHAGADAVVDLLDGMPALPFFIVQGNSWHFLYLEVMAERAVLWQYVLVGDTTSLRGVHQVLTALLAVMDWADRVWRPWYEDNILSPLCRALAG